MEKQAVRERIWDALEDEGVARFPFPPHGKIPNFAGAADAAERLASTEAWDGAAVVKSNPDSPQLPVRRAALRQGKTVYMAVPRLRHARCFLRLDPAAIDDIDHATTVGGSSEVGEQVRPDDMEPIDLIVAGSVAVGEHGGRIGKGEGYSDLEFAVLREFGLVGDDTTTATTVHELQVVSERIRTTQVDVPINLVATPDRLIRAEPPSKPSGIDWTMLDDERIAEIPVLAELAPDGGP